MKNKKSEKFIPKNFILDVDGVFTDGKFYYTKDGKIMKQFGPDDADALTFLKGKLNIHTISGDKRGFAITKKRIAIDMGLPLDLVSTFERVDWLEKRYNLDETIYMGDGIFDSLVFKKVAYSIAPANAFSKTKELADFVTSVNGGEGAVAEAVLYILENILHETFDIFATDLRKGSGVWRKNEIYKKK